MKLKTQPMRHNSLNLAAFLPDLSLYMSKAILSRVTRLALTQAHSDNMLTPLSNLTGFKNLSGLSNGFCRLFLTGFQKPHSAVFLYPQKITSIMVGWFGNSKELPFQLAVCKPESTRHPIFCSVSGGFLQITGVTTMNASIVKLFNELKSEIQSLRAELAALKAEKSPENNTAAANSVQCVEQSPQPKKDSILRLPDVLKIVGLSRSSVYAFIKSGKFPKQFKLGLRMSGWFESEIYAFVQSLSVVGGVA